MRATSRRVAGMARSYGFTSRVGCMTRARQEANRTGIRRLPKCPARLSK